MMNRLIVPLLLLVTLAACQASDGEVSTQTWQESLRIGGAVADTSEHVIGFVSDAATDTNGNIYVADGQMHEIHVYDPEGQYLRSFGEQGEGPGEFQTFSALHIDRQGRLLVADAQNNRISIFALDGELQQTASSPIDGRISHLAELPDGRFVLVGLADERLVHVVDADFEEVEASFADAEALQVSDGQLAGILQQFYPGTAAPVGDRVVAFVPFTYDGQVHLYEEHPDGTWQQIDAEEGFSFHDSPVTFSPADRAERIHLPITLRGEGRYAAQFHSASRGIYPRPDGGAVHLSAHEQDDHSLLLVEHLDDQGKLLSHFVADTLAIEDVVAIDAVWMDAEERLYTTDHREWPTLRQLRLRTADPR